MSDWITDYYTDVDGMNLQSFVDRHTDDAVVQFANTAVFEALLHYTTKGGAEVVVPCVSLLDRATDGRVSSLRVHIDLAPLFERIGAEATAQEVTS
jgi:hypothetical protein